MEPIQEVRLEAFEPNLHSAKLREWLHRQHVSRWWADPERALQSALLQTQERSAIIFSGSVPVGYVCWHPLSSVEAEVAGLSDLAASCIDIDILLGELEYVGVGIGPRALQALLARLGEDQSVSVAGVGVSVGNVSAIRAFEKAGFCVNCEFEDADYGSCLYMLAAVGDAV